MTLTTVLSVLRGADAGAAREADPALDVNAYAVAEDIDLTLVLKDQGVELGLVSAAPTPEVIAGLAVPAAEPATDLQALLGSGVRVCAVREDLRARGLGTGDLVEGVEPIDAEALAGMVADHDVTLTTTG